LRDHRRKTTTRALSFEEVRSREKKWARGRGGELGHQEKKKREGEDGPERGRGPREGLEFYF
jgi:hypothetical protein